MEEKNQNIEDSSKKEITQEESEEIQGGYYDPKYETSDTDPLAESDN